MRVIDLFPKDRERLFTVGRLDENSQGLLLVTNDGELAHRLAHPRYRVPRVYQVQVADQPHARLVQHLAGELALGAGLSRSPGKPEPLAAVVKQLPYAEPGHRATTR